MSKLLKTTRGKAGAVCVGIVVISLFAQFTGSAIGWGQWVVAAVLWLVIAYFIVRKELKYIRMDNSDIWGMWSGCQNTTDQDRRIQRAVAESFNIASEDLENGRAVFIGGKGKYKTTLAGCSCPDFKERKLPCKHMYKLAIDMRLLSVAEYTRQPDPDLAGASLDKQREAAENYAKEIGANVRK